MESLTGDSLTEIVQESEIVNFLRQAKKVREGEESRFSLVITRPVLAYLLKLINPQISDEAIQDYYLVLNYMGFNSSISDNCIYNFKNEKESIKRATRKTIVRTLFNDLQDMGLLRTERINDNFYMFRKERNQIKENPVKIELVYKSWRIALWEWNYPKIIDIVKPEINEENNTAPETELYDNLDDKAWDREI